MMEEELQDEDSECTPSLAAGSESPKPPRFRPPNEPPPAYSSVPKRRNDAKKWKSAAVFAGAGSCALLVCLLFGAFAEIRRLKETIADQQARLVEQKAENERLVGACATTNGTQRTVEGAVDGEANGESPADLQQCWDRVANLTDRLAASNAEAANRTAAMVERLIVSEIGQKASELRERMEQNEREDGSRKPHGDLAASPSFSPKATRHRSAAKAEAKKRERGRDPVGFYSGLVLVSAMAVFVSYVVLRLCYLAFRDARRKRDELGTVLFYFWVVFSVSAPVLLFAGWVWCVALLREFLRQ
ncbi:hypothetical protein M3Y99_00515200 [Aphelenchoides fujianensis]|nr:hypothetical protein M3Y99_00515200 [Aphelenchoides fujianensis]